MPEDVLTVTRRELEHWNNQDLDAIVSGWHPDVVVRPDPYFPDSEPLRGAEAARRFYESQRDSMGWGRLEVLEEHALGDRCLHRVRQHVDAPMSGVKGAYDWSVIRTVRDGLITDIEFHMAADEAREAAGVAGPGRIAFLGLGIMGRPMAANLARAGFAVLAFNRTRERAEELAAEHDNVTVAGTAAEAAAAGIAISMVPDVPEVEAVLLGPDGAADGLPEGGLAIDMSTIAPTASRSVGERLGERGFGFLDAPVTGSRPKAEDGTLTVMAGGPEDAFARARPAFEAMGELVLHVGPQGHGSMIKLINNTLAAVNAAGLAEGIVLARRAGADVEKMLEVVASGSGDSAMRALKSGPMLEGDFEPLFKLEHMLKDVRYLILEARALGLEPTVAQAAERRYAEANGAGLGSSDFAAVIEAVRP